MFEHLDDVLQPANPLDDPDYAGIRERTLRAQRRRAALATTVTVSVLATGGVAGLALNGIDIRDATPGGGPLLAIGAPRDRSPGYSSADLTASESTPTNQCPRVLTPASTTTGTSASTPVTVLPAIGGSRPTPTPSPSIAAISGGASAASSGSVVVVGGGGSVTVVPAHPSGSTGSSSSGGAASSGGGTTGTRPPIVLPTFPPPPILPGGGGDDGSGGNGNGGGDGGGGVVDPIPDPPPTSDPTDDPGDGSGGGDGGGGDQGGSADPGTGGQGGDGTTPMDGLVPPEILNLTIG